MLVLSVINMKCFVFWLLWWIFSCFFYLFMIMSLTTSLPVILLVTFKPDWNNLWQWTFLGYPTCYGNFENVDFLLTFLLMVCIHLLICFVARGSSLFWWIRTQATLYWTSTTILWGILGTLLSLFFSLKVFANVFSLFSY